MPVGVNVYTEVTFADLALSAFADPDFDAAFRAAFQSALAGESGARASQVLIHAVVSGSAVVRSSVEVPAGGEEAARALATRLDADPARVFGAMADYGAVTASSQVMAVDNSTYVGERGADKTVLKGDAWYEPIESPWFLFVLLLMGMIGCGLALGLAACITSWITHKTRDPSQYQASLGSNTGGVQCSEVKVATAEEENRHTAT